MVDLLLGPIVGGLSSSSANLWGRADGEGILHGWVGRNSDLSDAQPAGQSGPLTEADGFTGVAPLNNLAPNTHYHYALTLDDTPPDPTQGPYPEFTTFAPAGQKVSFAFAFGSCFRPQGEVEGQIFQSLEARRKLDDLRFILLLGDQIYADEYNHNGIGKIASSLEDYRAVYKYAWQRPAIRHLLANLPAFMTMDDHEVDNDWYWRDSRRQQPTIPWINRLIRRLKGLTPTDLSRQRVQDALKAYWEHQGMHAPPVLEPPKFDPPDVPDDLGSLAYSFTFGAAAFFVMDTRTGRVRSGAEKKILGDKQWQALEEWLLRVKETYPVKFLVTSSTVLINLWIDFIFGDRWSQFPAERSRLLNFVADNGLEGVYLLSGDLHSAHAIGAELTGPSGDLIPVWEFCATPFQQDPNRLAKYTFNPRPYGRIKRLQRHFSLLEPNFGLVRVDFPKAGPPQVSFEVYGQEGQRLASINTGA